MTKEPTNMSNNSTGGSNASGGGVDSAGGGGVKLEDGPNAFNENTNHNNINDSKDNMKAPGSIKTEDHNPGSQQPKTEPGLDGTEIKEENGEFGSNGGE